MTPRSASGANRNAEQHRPSKDEAERGIDPRQEIAGLDLTDTIQSGLDDRHRGWYWNWNTTITHFSPLIGLKGVGLLTSYIVWTDRREKSPHRGYAFPSQQSEADFYGEERSELITINKILVTLKFVEIHKAMASRPGEQGKWKARHNLYRVIDRPEEYKLTTKDVLKVAELAERDPAVFRYVRRSYSSRFKPIDKEGPWPAILVELADSDLWRRLTGKVAEEERRASARTKAGHAARKTPLDASIGRDARTLHAVDDDSAAVEIEPVTQTSVAATNIGLKTGVAPANRGSTIDVGLGNKGSGKKRPTSVEPSNGNGSTHVAPTNRMYNELTLTTTTTIPPRFISELEDVSRNAVTTESSLVNDEFRRPPGDGPAEQRALLSFEEANGRTVSVAERRLLTELADDFDRAALKQSPLASGWSWVSAGIYEAVEAGSAFVAPRRVREILARWERDGAPAAASHRGGRRSTDPEREPEMQREPAPMPVPLEEPAGEGIFLIDECGMPSLQVWHAVLDEIVANHGVSKADRDAWLRPARLGGRGPNRELIIIAPSALAQRRIARRMRQPLRAAVASVIGRDIDLDVRIAQPALPQDLGPEPERGRSKRTG